ncbi:hypothetical protein IQ266_03145 [filamentous cyanobacterium LEGE 11480]|uniref:SbsA Ig-like domain-containing protein n=1 Tax=Romeriopsis navalis LEGE 11480 TaxID=2777977 RepID=A0A928VMK5_9CYAN|nr:Ig-like domain-containing protein [Romeriopsis navalis]MBE9028754.1 hypothetical protein [Romeriopsis navalis LEGE 11480]
MSNSRWSPLNWYKQRAQPLDRIAIALLLSFSFAIVVLLSSGNHSAPKVRDFSWDNQQINARDTAFTVTFSRPMDQLSVQQGLQIEPPLPGKFSWAGRRMAYTLNAPVEYGQNFKLSFTGGKERFNQTTQLQPFNTEFSSRDRMFAFIGAVEDQTERLVLVNMTKKENRILTPSNLQVLDFYPYPDREKIAFAAVDRQAENLSPTEQQIYTVTTGIGKAEAGQVELLLDNKTYQNLRFALSEDGQLIVVQRVNRANTNEFDPWVLRPNKPPEVLKTKQPGGEFVITPDSSAIAIAQGQGLAILPLESGAEPLGFLPKFGTVLSFSRDGSKAAMLKFNNDFTRSLFIVNNQGIETEILKITGSIRDAIFDPTQRFLFCLLTELQEGETFKEQPYLAVIDLETAIKKDPKIALKPLVKLPQQREIQVSLAADGRALLFDQTENDPNLAAKSATSLQNSRLWILPTETLLAGDWKAPISPIELMPGFHPRWLP